MSNDEIEGQDEEEAEWRANSQTYEQSCGWRIRMVTMMMRRRRRIVLRYLAWHAHRARCKYKCSNEIQAWKLRQDRLDPIVVSGDGDGLHHFASCAATLFKRTRGPEAARAR